MWPSCLMEHLSAVSPVVLPLLLDAAVKGLVILTLTALATLALPRASAATRHLIWFLGALGLLVLPILMVGLPGWYILPRWTVHMASPAREQPATAPTPAAVPPSADPKPLANHAPRTEAIAPDLAPSPGAPFSTRPPSPAWQAWALAAWLAGAGLLLSYALLGFLSLWWLRHQCHRITEGEWPILLRRLCAELGIRRPVELLGSDRRTMPMTWGLWRTCLLLPEESATWTAEQRRTVLLHELAHAKRWDCLMQLLVQIACALHWFNPLAWLAWRRMQSERERACDDRVLSCGTKPSAYAEHLLSIASTMPAIRLGAAAIAMARPSKLEGRLLAILDVRRSREGLSKAMLALIAAAAIATVLPISMMRAAAIRTPLTLDRYGIAVPTHILYVWGQPRDTVFILGGQTYASLDAVVRQINRIAEADHSTYIRVRLCPPVASAAGIAEELSRACRDFGFGGMEFHYDLLDDPRHSANPAATVRVLIETTSSNPGLVYHAEILDLDHLGKFEVAPYHLGGPRLRKTEDALAKLDQGDFYIDAQRRLVPIRGARCLALPDGVPETHGDWSSWSATRASQLWARLEASQRPNVTGPVQILARRSYLARSASGRIVGLWIADAGPLSVELQLHPFGQTGPATRPAGTIPAATQPASGPTSRPAPPRQAGVGAAAPMPR